MTFVYSSQEFNYPFALKLLFKTVDKLRQSDFVSVSRRCSIVVGSGIIAQKVIMTK